MFGCLYLCDAGSCAFTQTRMSAKISRCKYVINFFEEDARASVSPSTKAKNSLIRGTITTGKTKAKSSSRARPRTKLLRLADAHKGDESHGNQTSGSTDNILKQQQQTHPSHLCMHVLYQWFVVHKQKNSDKEVNAFCNSR